MSLGQATSFAPNYNKGAAAAGFIKHLIESEPQIDSYSTEGKQPVSDHCSTDSKYFIILFSINILFFAV